MDFPTTAALGEYCSRVQDKLTLRLPTHDCTVETLQLLVTQFGKDKVASKIKHMLGYPCENLDSFERTLRFLIQTDAELLSVCVKSPWEACTGTFMDNLTSRSKELYECLESQNLKQLVEQLIEDRKLIPIPEQLFQKGIASLLEGNPSESGWLVLRLWLRESNQSPG